jgi:peptide deformylase
MTQDQQDPQNRLRILNANNPEDNKILRTKSIEVTEEELKSPEFQTFINDLKERTLACEELEGQKAGGMAAPQVGVNKRVAYIWDEQTKGLKLIINPKVKLHPEKGIDNERCFSYPGIEGPVERSEIIDLEYKNLKGESVTEQLIGFEARVAQHEIDHLDGILFTDRALSTENITD